MSEWLNMGGYALYVWGSFMSAFVVYAWNLIAPGLRRREILKQLDSE